MKTEVPNSWYVFVNSKDGKVKFGGIDQNNKPINGTNIPFKVDRPGGVGNYIYDFTVAINVTTGNRGSQYSIRINHENVGFGISIWELNLTFTLSNINNAIFAINPLQEPTLANGEYNCLVNLPCFTNLKKRKQQKSYRRKD